MLSIMKKSDIRKLYKEKRNQLSKNEIDSIEYSIIDKIKTLNITSKKNKSFFSDRKSKRNKYI